MPIVSRWSLGQNNCRIAYYDERDLPNIKIVNNIPRGQWEFFQIRLAEWPTDKKDARKTLHNLLPYDLDFRTYDQWQKNGPPEFEMRYADGCEACEYPCVWVGRSP